MHIGAEPHCFEHTCGVTGHGGLIPPPIPLCATMPHALENRGNTGSLALDKATLMPGH